MSLQKNYYRVLIIDDDRDFISLLAGQLEEEGFRCQGASDPKEINTCLEQFSFDFALLDLNLGTLTGLDVLPQIMRSNPRASVIMMTANASIETAVEAIKRGATDYVVKDGGPRKIVDTVLGILDRTKIQAKKKGPFNFSEFGLLGESGRMQQLFAQLEQIKNTDATVCILGESGTGKEVVARALHEMSNRHDHPFEAINCAAIPDTLLESELFGVKRGAYTDAKVDRKGIFEVCSEGTLLLDEISEMPLALQAKLLRVLQQKEVTPLGGGRTIKINTRIIAATNKNLTQLVGAGQFREDLYFRVNLIPLMLPALRERIEDIPNLAQHFLDRFSKLYNKTFHPLDRECVIRLQSYEWPGNVRELQNGIERAVILATSDLINPLDVLPKPQPSSSSGSGLNGAEMFEPTLNYNDAKESFERSYLLHLLSVSKGNIAEAARISGKYRSDIYRLLKRHKLEIYL